MAPLLWADLTSKWNTSVYVVDASEWGVGACRADLPLFDVQRLGRMNERWRFRSEAAILGARGHTALAAGSSLIGVTGDVVERLRVTQMRRLAEQQGGCERRPAAEWEGVAPALLDRDWRVVGRKEWSKQETMPVLEARGVLYAVKHGLRTLANHGTRLVVLGDSLSAAGDISKGRGQARGLLRVAQQLGALLLSTGTQLRYRWIPSERNPSDGPSRGWWRRLN